MKAMSFERLFNLVNWLSVQANVSTAEVMIRFVDGELRLRTASGDTSYVLKVVDDESC